jgi:hypothetical protein
MPRTKNLPMIGLLVVLATPAAAQERGELDCKLVIEAIRAQEQEAGALRRNVATLETAIRGSD